jgi:pimeloyl-ACP methyl ester carboxylesterase
VNDLFVESWGEGTPVVLVHGSLATGAEEWEAQRPLADEGFRLLVPDRRGYGKSPAAAEGRGSEAWLFSRYRARPDGW